MMRCVTCRFSNSSVAHGVTSQPPRNDGSSYVQVLYRLDGKQTSTSFHDMGSATKFNKLVASELRAWRHPFRLPSLNPARLRTPPQSRG
jgi:hypothetical protein